MAIVCHSNLSPREFAQTGGRGEVRRPLCPKCSAVMIFWGSYERVVRLATSDVRVRIRRAMCKSCRSSHGLVPGFVALGRLDDVEAIGEAVTEMAGGKTAAAIAARAGLPYTTVRDWRRRFTRRAGLLATGLLQVIAALGDLVPNLPGGAVRIAVAAVALAAATLRRRFGTAGSDWRLANLVVGGHLFTTNTNPPWIAA
jgi:RNase P subunit RPR2